MSQYHHGNLRNSIIEAAIDIISSQGIEKLSIRATAKIIGVSHTAPYRHFKNKEELIVAVALKGFEKLGSKIDPIFQNYSNDVRELIFNAGKTYIGFAVENKNYYRIMFGNHILNKTGYPDFFEAYDSLFKQFTDIVYRYKNSDGNTFSYNDASVVTLSYFSMIHGYSSLIIDNGEDEKFGKEGQINLILRNFVNILD